MAERRKLSEPGVIATPSGSGKGNTAAAKAIEAVGGAVNRAVTKKRVGAFETEAMSHFGEALGPVLIDPSPLPEKTDTSQAVAGPTETDIAEEAAKAPPVKDFSGQMGKIDALVRQGKLSASGIKMRVQAALTAHIKEYPYLAPEFEKKAQQVLGHRSELLSVIGAAETAAAKAAESAKDPLKDMRKSYQKAVDEGLVPQSKIPVHKMTEKQMHEGLQVASTHRLGDRLKAQAKEALAQTTTGQTIDKEKRDLAFVDFSANANSRVTSMISPLIEVAGRLESLSPDQFRELQQSLSATRTSMDQWIVRNISDYPDLRSADLVQNLQGNVAALTKLFDDPDRSIVAQRGKVLTYLQDTMKLKIHQMAPTMTRMEELLGPQGMAEFAKSTLSVDAELFNEVFKAGAGEVSNVLDSPDSVEAAKKANVSELFLYLQGNKTYQDLKDPEKRTQMFAMNLNALKAIDSADVKKATPTQMRSWLNATSFIGHAVQDTVDPTDVEAFAAQVAPIFTQGWDKVSKTLGGELEVDVAADSIRKGIAKMLPVAINNAKGNFQGESVVYNRNSGKFEVSKEKSTLLGRRFPDPRATLHAKTLNSLLHVGSELREHDETTQGLDDLQVRQFFAEKLGASLEVRGKDTLTEELVKRDKAAQANVKTEEATPNLADELLKANEALQEKLLQGELELKNRPDLSKVEDGSIFQVDGELIVVENGKARKFNQGDTVG